MKFTESIDLSMKINLKKIKGPENSLRALVELPNGNGKKLKVAILCDENKLADAKKSGADVIGSEDLLKKISDKDINFDKLICTASMMPKIGKLGKILGRSVPTEAVADTIQQIVDVYVDLRAPTDNDVESFGELVERVGIDPFKEKVYG